MTTYLPQTGVFMGRPPCENCGAAFRLHGLSGTTGVELAASANSGDRLACPTAYRPASLDEARARLAEAETSGDQARIFVARGDLQRLQAAPAPPQRPVEVEVQDPLTGKWHWRAKR